MSLYRFYTYKDKVLIPTVVQAEEGFYMDEEPVTVCGISERAGLEAAIREMLEQSNAVVPTPEISNDPGSVILQRLDLKKWLKFEPDAQMFTLQLNNGRADYYSTGPAVNGSWHPNNMRHSSFDVSGSFDPLVNAVLNDIGRVADAAAVSPKSGGLIIRPPDIETS